MNTKNNQKIMKFELPNLGYAYNALEPHIDAETMQIHHQKHHQAYMDKLNIALDGHEELQDKSIEELLSNLEQVPKEIRGAVRNNGGGYYHHSIFWKMLVSDGGEKPEGVLADKIDETFGDFDQFKDEFEKAATTQFGSGWAWLSKNSNNELIVHSTPNQDSPLSEGLTPLLGIDVWEHAYYLNYQNRRPEYIKAFWQLINWDYVAKTLAQE